MGRLELTDPYEIARTTASVILVAQADLNNLQSIDTMAQIWTADGGYSRPTRLQVMFKFLYNVVETVPPVQWNEPNGNNPIET